MNQLLIWNYFAQYLGTATISFFGGLLLWGIIALSFILLNKRHFIMSFAIPNTMTTDELSEIFKRAQQEDAEAIIKEIENKKEDWK